jgi:hypothetical protein
VYEVTVQTTSVKGARTSVGASVGQESDQNTTGGWSTGTERQLALE